MSYNWRYFKTGRVTQVKIETGEDVAHLKELDRKLWTALSAPIHGLRFDRRTLELIDSDHDGVVRAPEVLAAVDWALANVASPDDLFQTDEKKAELEAALADVMSKQADLDAAEPSEADKAAQKAWEDAPKADAAILPLGDKTAAADAALAAVEPTIDAFFAVPDDLPLVTEEPDKALPLTGNLNPKWYGPIIAFAETCAAPALGAEAPLAELTRSQWTQVKAKFAPYRAWLAAKPVAAADAKAKLVEDERLLRYKLYLVPFLRNFVNQADLYAKDALAIYQTGTLYIDGRSCELCFHVDDEGAHSALAAKSNCCIIYAKLTRKSTGETRTACAVVTAGRTGPLYVGRNGLFVDRDGNDWNAVITKMVEAQVSLKEAFWAPWVKLFNTVADQIKKFLGAKQDAATAQVGKVTAAPPSKENSGANGAAIASSVAALGVGVGMLGAACAGMISVVAGLPAWKVAVGLVAVVLLVSLPSVILTWFKLRTRDLGAVLNAGGWAVNRPLYFSTSLARTFTRLPPCRCAWGWLLLLALLAIGVTAAFFFLRCGCCAGTCA